MSVVKPVANTLSCTTTHTKQPTSAKVKELTNVTVFFGNIPIASKILAGHWNDEQALREFRKTCMLWTRLNEEGFLQASALNLM